MLKYAKSNHGGMVEKYTVNKEGDRGKCDKDRIALDDGENVIGV